MSEDDLEKIFVMAGITDIYKKSTDDIYSKRQENIKKAYILFGMYAFLNFENKFVLLLLNCMNIISQYLNQLC